MSQLNDSERDFAPVLKLRRHKKLKLTCNCLINSRAALDGKLVSTIVPEYHVTAIDEWLDLCQAIGTFLSYVIVAGSSSTQVN